MWISYLVGRNISLFMIIEQNHAAKDGSIRIVNRWMKTLDRNPICFIIQSH